MTVSTTALSVDYVGNGVTTAFATTFPFLESSHLVVTVNGTTVGSAQYAVSGGAGLTGTVTFLTAPVADAEISITREVPATQLIDYLRNDPFPAETHEKGLDKLTMLVQQIIRGFGRTFRFSDAEVAAVPVASALSKYPWINSLGALTFVTGDPSQPITHRVEVVYPTAGQTSIPVSGYTPGSGDLSVYRRVSGETGAHLLVPGIQYIEATSTSITLVTPSVLNDTIILKIGDVFDVTLAETAKTSENQTATEGQTVVTLGTSYTPGYDEIEVFINGVLFSPGVRYTETNATTITMTEALAAGDEIRVIYGQAYNPAVGPTAAQVGDVLYPLTTGEIAAGVTPTAYQYPPGDTRRYGLVGDGTDETARLRNCYSANPGGVVIHENGKTYLISAGVTLYTGTEYRGRAKIKQLDGANFAGALLTGTAVSNVLIDDLEVDGNKANNTTGLTYGIKLTGGSNNRITSRVHVHDTTQAGTWINDETGTWDYSRAIDCGANLGTDSHGKMFTAIAGNLLNCGVGGLVTGAYRKGIATYSNTPGAVTNFVVDHPIITGCVNANGGGLYLSAVTGTTDQKAIVIKGLIATGNYVNLLIAGCNGVVGTGVVLKDAIADNLNVVDSTDVNIPGHVNTGAAFKPAFIDGCTRVTLPDADIVKTVATGGAFCPGIHILDSTYCGAPGATVLKNGGNLTHGIFEEGATDYSNLDGVLTDGTVKYTLTGANTALRSRQTDVIAVASVAALTLPPGFGSYSITGTTAVTSIVTTGFKGKLVLLTFTGVLTFTDGSNIKLAGGLDFTTSGDDTLLLFCDGTSFLEVARSVN